MLLWLGSHWNSRRCGALQRLEKKEKTIHWHSWNMLKYPEIQRKFTARSWSRNPAMVIRCLESLCMDSHQEIWYKRKRKVIADMPGIKTHHQYLLYTNTWSSSNLPLPPQVVSDQTCHHWLVHKSHIPPQFHQERPKKTRCWTFSSCTAFLQETAVQRKLNHSLLTVFFGKMANNSTFKPGFSQPSGTNKVFLGTNVSQIFGRIWIESGQCQSMLSQFSRCFFVAR